MTRSLPSSSSPSQSPLSFDPGPVALVSQQPHDHGGPDGGPPVRIDFSTNAHPLGPTPSVHAAVRQALLETYPDPSYAALREVLADFHRVAPERIVPGASGSELIWRLTQSFAQATSAAGPRGEGAHVVLDAPTFGEYARAAASSGLPVRSGMRVDASTAPCLRWLCRPNNPTGESLADSEMVSLAARCLTRGWPLVVDLAYQPFAGLLRSMAPAGRADPHPAVLESAWADQVVQLWSPNKLHGLTGVRGAYLVLPLPSSTPAAWRSLRLAQAAPSWVLGADGLALLQAHLQPAAWHSLRQHHPTLQAWKAHQDAALQAAGWTLRPSPLHFGLAAPPALLREPACAHRWHALLRAEGLMKLRRGDSFGLPGWVRLCTRAPAQVETLIELTRHALATS